MPCLELKLSQLQAFPRTQAVLYYRLERKPVFAQRSRLYQFALAGGVWLEMRLNPSFK